MSAFVPGSRLRVPASAHGPLDHLRFAVKDLIDVAGVTTGAGNPDWLASHAPAAGHSPCVAALLAAGATLEGKTITDELAFSLEGANHHYGTPLNPHWPHALPGGSSSGSASAVASGDVDFALGTDTGGSVRVPAAFCGVWGMRPTHDAIALAGVVPFAPCFDTVGWFARSVDVLAAVGDVLLPPASTLADADAGFQNTRLVRNTEAFDTRMRHEPEDATRLLALAESLGARSAVNVFANHGEAARWLACYQYVQDFEIDRSLGDWLRDAQPHFGPSIAERFARQVSLDRETRAAWYATLAELRVKLDPLLADGTVLILPTTPVALLPKDIDGAALGRFYEDALTLNALATLGGLPQISMPFSDDVDRPLALSLIGARGSDRALLDFARHLYSRHYSATSH
ncbi:amidase [Paraburkholderia sp. BCC1886]|uniref:amidase n=1 Tax=Paraburkholderia sp. BCC1886 TaxID=2562670 RepID=UPI0011822B41|nr:amidase [Paraburkholderia sp. BCC1886]